MLQSPCLFSAKSAVAIVGLTLSPQAGLPQERAGTAADTPLPVQIVAARMAPVTVDVKGTGTIVAEDSYSASFREGGQIIEMNVDVGDRVAAGEMLARVDPTRFDAAAAAARASVAAAEAALRQAGQARERAASLLERGAGTQAQLDTTSEAFLTARSLRDQAAIQLAKVERALEDTVLRAVDNGIITERLADPGEVVGAGQTVLTVADESIREAVFFAPDVAGLNSLLSQPVQLTPLEGNQRFEAVLTEVSPVVSEFGTVEVKVALAKGQGADLPIGTPVQARVELVQGPAIAVPWTALTATAEGPAVWTVDSESMTVRLTPVTIAGYADEVVEISEGLTEADLVVGAGSHTLYPGRVVAPADIMR